MRYILINQRSFTVSQRYCQRGFTNDLSDLDKCLPCPRAYFKVTPGSSPCIRCGPGFSTNSEGSATCERGKVARNNSTRNTCLHLKFNKKT